MKTHHLYLQDFFLNKHNIDVSGYDETFLQKSLEKRMKETKCISLDEYGLFLQQRHDERDEFIQSLQISYSAFFRDVLTFAVIDRLLLPLIIAHKKGGNEIRIWSAACAAGQEPYSLAMLLEEHINTEINDISYRIFATDCNAKQIELAQKGTYHTGQISNLSYMRLCKWFTKAGSSYSVKPELKKNIDFSTFNLLDEKISSPSVSIFGGFHIVFCANLLFYYNEEFRKKIIDKVIDSLDDDGYLVVDGSEREILLNYGLKEIYPHSSIFKL